MNVPVKAFDLLEDEDDEVVLLAEAVLLAEELLLLVGLAEVRWRKDMASFWVVHDHPHDKREIGERNREMTTKSLLDVAFRGSFGDNSIRCGAALPNDQRCVWSGRRVEERGRSGWRALY